MTTSVSRRQLAKGAAWSVPAAASAVPAMAVSQDQEYASVCKIFTGDGYRPLAAEHDVYFTFGSDAPGGSIPKGTVFTFAFTLSGGQTMEVPQMYPTSGQTSGGLASTTISPSSGTSATAFTMTVTFNRDASASDLQNTMNCEIGVKWTTDSEIAPGTTVTVNMRSSGQQVKPASGSLSWKVPQRMPVATNRTGRTPLIYLSKSGSQTCYPETRFTLNGSSTRRECAESGTINSTSTIYPGGRCVAVSNMGTSGQYSHPPVC